MKWLHLLSSLALAGSAAIHMPAAEPDGIAARVTAPVLRPTEPADNVVLRLPGAPAPKRAVVPAPAAAALPVVPPSQPAPSVPAPEPMTMPAVAEKPASRPVETANRFEPPKPLATPEVPAPKPETTAKSSLPPDFVKDTARFCQGKIGQWKESDARALFGAPRRQRPAYDDNNLANGKIYAFSDPTGRYKEVELDFNKAGKLRTVYGYPPKLTWKECQKLWGDKFASADAKDGRTFYSYLNRRLDVLVDQKGNVISVGLY